MRTQQTELSKQWQALIARQERSGQSVRAFCRENNVGDHSFYLWRRRLRGEAAPASFALVETGSRALAARNSPIELQFPGGERLHVSPGAGAATLRTVLAAMRERA